MSDQLWLYPRLPRTVAEDLAMDLRDVSAERRAELSTFSHPRAAPAPTGGSPVPEERLRKLSEAVRLEFLNDMEEPMPSGGESDVDARLGRVLHDGMSIIPSDAAHEGVWSFLSLVLLPDVAAWRFPDCHPARLVGTHRNVYRRTWWRQHVLGDLMQHEGSRPLGEDELVNIFERSRMARSHGLARGMARYILSSEVADRSHFARELAKRIRRLLAYVNVDALAESQIDQLITKAGGAVLDTRSIDSS